MAQKKQNPQAGGAAEGASKTTLPDDSCTDSSEKQPSEVPDWFAFIFPRCRDNAYAKKWINENGEKQSAKVDGRLDPAKINQHFDPAVPCWYGGYYVKPGDDRTRLGTIDLDDHDGTLGTVEIDRRANAVTAHLKVQGIHPAVFRSSGGHGRHLTCYWDWPQQAAAVRQTLCAAVEAAGIEVKSGVAEIFPKQNKVEEGRYGNPVFFPIERLDEGDWQLSSPLPDVLIKAKPLPEVGCYTGSLALLQKALGYIPNEGVGQPYGEDGEFGYLTVGMALHDATQGGSDGLALWHEWASRSLKYDADDVERRWWSFCAGVGVTDRTLYWKAAQHGFDASQVVIEGFAGIGKVLAGVLPPETQAQTVEPAKAPTLIFTGPEASRCSWLFDQEPPEREFIIERVMPVTNGALFAPGGIGKTTLTIREAIHIVLGRDIWLRRVLRPGPVLFLTGEDSREDFALRLHRLADAMQLSPLERKQVAAGIFVEDVSHCVARLAELDRSGNIVMTSRVDEISRLYSKEGLAVVNIDPMVYFGAGERLVNDAEAVMTQVAKRLSGELNAHVRLVHHTGKAVAREGIADQYSGRGGSALSDGSRQVMQLLEGADKKWRLPAEAEKLMGLGYQALRVHFHKISYAPHLPEPVWLLRAGWKFFEFDSPAPDGAAALAADTRRIQHFLREHLARGIYLSRTALEEACTEVGLAKRRIHTLVSMGLQTGEIIEMEIPADKRRGGLVNHLVPGEKTGEVKNGFFG